MPCSFRGRLIVHLSAFLPLSNMLRQYTHEAGKDAEGSVPHTASQSHDLRHVGAWASSAGQSVADSHAMGWDMAAFAYTHTNPQHDAQGPHQTVQAPPLMPRQQALRQEQPKAVAAELPARLVHQAPGEANFAAAAHLQDGSGEYSLDRYLADEDEDPGRRRCGPG